MAAALAVGAGVYGATGSGMFGSAHGTLTAEMLTVPSGAHGAALPVTASGGVADAGSARVQVAARQALRRAATHAAPSRSARPSASASASPSPSPSPSTTTLSCSDNSSLLPYNVTTIVNFLVEHGYSHTAAAGIAGNIYQESKGDPESVGSGGGGLIGFTPLPSGYVTGNASSDLQTQLEAILTYNQQWSSYLPALNSASTPSSAAYIYVTYFERAGIPETSTREASADAVAAACGL